MPPYSGIRGAATILGELRRLQDEDKTRERAAATKAGFVPSSIFPAGKEVTGAVDESSVIQGKALPIAQAGGDPYVQFQSESEKVINDLRKAQTDLATSGAEKNRATVADKFITKSGISQDKMMTGIIALHKNYFDKLQFKYKEMTPQQQQWAGELAMKRAVKDYVSGSNKLGVQGNVLLGDVMKALPRIGGGAFNADTIENLDSVIDSISATPNASVEDMFAAVEQASGDPGYTEQELTMLLSGVSEEEVLEARQPTKQPDVQDKEDSTVVSGLLSAADKFKGKSAADIAESATRGGIEFAQDPSNIAGLGGALKSIASTPYSNLPSVAGGVYKGATDRDLIEDLRVLLERIQPGALPYSPRPELDYGGGGGGFVEGDQRGLLEALMQLIQTDLRGSGQALRTSPLREMVHGKPNTGMQMQPHRNPQLNPEMVDELMRMIQGQR